MQYIVILYVCDMSIKTAFLESDPRKSIPLQNLRSAGSSVSEFFTRPARCTGLTTYFVALYVYNCGGIDVVWSRCTSFSGLGCLWSCVFVLLFVGFCNFPVYWFLKSPSVQMMHSVWPDPWPVEVSG